MGSIKRSLRMAFTLTMVATLVAMTAGVASAAGPNAKASYNSVPTNVPGNMPSQPFQAQQTSEFGDLVALAGSAPEGRLGRRGHVELGMPDRYLERGRLRHEARARPSLTRSR